MLVCSINVSRDTFIFYLPKIRAASPLIQQKGAKMCNCPFLTINRSNFKEKHPTANAETVPIIVAEKEIIEPDKLCKTSISAPRIAGIDSRKE